MTMLDAARRLAAVRHRMTVIDCAGHPVGFVCAIKRPDPLAVNAASQRIGQSSDLAALLPGALVAGEPRVTPVAVAARLVQHGYLRINASRTDHVDRYALADDVADVSDGVVRLSVPREALAVQHSGG